MERQASYGLSVRLSIRRFCGRTCLNEKGVKVSEVEKTIVSALQAKFPSYKLVISPKAQEVLELKYDGLT